MCYTVNEINSFVNEGIKERPNTVEQKEMREADKVLSKNPIILYHGNRDKGMQPFYGAGKSDTDYGKGFYTTPDKELGKEWAWTGYTRGDKGWLHTYELNTTGLQILDLTKLDSLHWIAELLANRHLNMERKEVLQDIVEPFISKYKLDTSKYDVIVGYRADDSYFTYTTDFITGQIYRETLENALRYGDLGLQVFIKSEKAFKSLKEVAVPEEVPAVYAQRYRTRDTNAREKYKVNKRQRALKKELITDFIER